MPEQNRTEQKNSPASRGRPRGDVSQHTQYTNRHQTPHGTACTHPWGPTWDQSPRTNTSTVRVSPVPSTLSRRPPARLSSRQSLLPPPLRASPRSAFASSALQSPCRCSTHRCLSEAAAKQLHRLNLPRPLRPLHSCMSKCGQGPAVPPHHALSRLALRPQLHLPHLSFWHSNKYVMHIN